jgi:aminopeptidase N
VEGLSFSENDYITMAYELMLKHPGEQDTIKNRQLERIDGKEKKQEFRFVARALAEDQQTRDSFFRSLLDEKNREKEPWVSKALHYLHHPIRAEQSVRYITPALEELREIQATGDIFFPKAWLDATLWGHSSKEAARAVRQFLEAHPDYPEKLENKILQSADLLFRTSKSG